MMLWPGSVSQRLSNPLGIIHAVSTVGYRKIRVPRIANAPECISGPTVLGPILAEYFFTNTPPIDLLGRLPLSLTEMLVWFVNAILDW